MTKKKNCLNKMCTEWSNINPPFTCLRQKLEGVYLFMCLFYLSIGTWFYVLVFMFFVFFNFIKNYINSLPPTFPCMWTCIWWASAGRCCTAWGISVRNSNPDFSSYVTCQVYSSTLRKRTACVFVKEKKPTENAWTNYESDTAFIYYCAYVFRWTLKLCYSVQYLRLKLAVKLGI